MDSAREVFDQAASDNIFFLASGLTFSLLLAAIPFLALLLAVAGLALGPQLTAPRGVVLDWIQSLLPVSEEIAVQVRESLLGLVDASRSVGWIGLILFAWFSTRLFGALRTVLDSVFDLREGPGILRSKLLDLRLVVVATLLLTANVGITTAFLAASREFLGHLPLPEAPTIQVVGYATAFAAIFLMFLLIYKFVPAARLQWRTAAVAALVASTGFELLKAALGWYIAEVADFSRVFFAFATVVIVVVSFYYAAVLFVLGAEVSKVDAMRRAMRSQREAFDGA
ncbi:MAG: YihY/virulence factor BrkB family protein [Gemmatimonadota bacterium]|nr:YihY/virulence factor BrkB family protein [Gemmatimonadota bacterium]